MTILAIDTTTQSCSAAITHQGVIAERFEIAPRQHTELILPMIEELLVEMNLMRQELQAIAFAAGPGSFMGTRLATGVAQGLGYALDIPLIPVSTLQILAQTAYEKHGCRRVVCGWDARMQEVYWGVYQEQQGLMQPLQSDRLSSIKEIDSVESDYVRVGNIWNDEVLYPHATALLSLAVPLFESGHTVSAMKAEPVYLRNNVVS